MCIGHPFFILQVAFDETLAVGGVGPDMTHRIFPAAHRLELVTWPPISKAVWEMQGAHE